jgi:hypothetical protein
VNKANKGFFKRVVKLLKAWNGHLPESARFKSFAIETLAATLFTNARMTSVPDGVFMFFDFICYLGSADPTMSWSDSYGLGVSKWWGCTIPDLAGTGSNVGAKHDSGACQRFIEKARRSRDLLLKAERARYDDTTENYIHDALKV